MIDQVLIQVVKHMVKVVKMLMDIYWKLYLKQNKISRDLYLSASGDVKSTIIQSEASSNILSLFNEWNK